MCATYCYLHENLYKNFPLNVSVRLLVCVFASVRENKYPLLYTDKHCIKTDQLFAGC